MKRQETTNTFSDGLVMDFNPLLTPNTVLTNALNATILTMNGNENVLQNDMGNGRVETACLPEGYIPLGTAELGGIIYIASYNPLTNKSQIGSFPSPERNVTSDEVGNVTYLHCKDFYGTYVIDYEDDSYYPVITDTVKVLLTDTQLKIGDKFCVGSNNIQKNSEVLSAFNNQDNNINKDPKYLKLHIVSIQDDGKIVYLDDNLVWYSNPNYYINSTEPISNGKITLSEYRDVINSNYSVFTSSVPGKLAIIAKLEVIEEFTASVKVAKQKDDQVTCSFNTNWIYNNDDPESRKLVNPKYIVVNWKKKTENQGEVAGWTFLEIPTEQLQNRNNDGFDPEISFSEILDISDAVGIVKLTIYPVMEYGYIEYLGTSVNIDMDKLGKDITDLNEYRYYIEDSILTLSYGFDSYPNIGESVNSVEFNFYPFNDTNYKALFLDGYDVDNDAEGNDCAISNLWTTTNINLEKELEYSIENKASSMLGHFDKVIYFDQSEESGLKKNQCYIVKLTINYTKETRYYYRILYTSDIFNSAYYSETDFNELILENYIEFTPKSSVAINTISESRTLQQDNSTIDQIPYKQDESTTQEYKIIDQFEDELSATISLDSSNSIISKHITGVQEYEISTSNDHNSTIQYISNAIEVSNITFADTTKLFDIKADNSGNIKITNKYVYSLFTPIKVFYNDLNYLQTAYQLSNLEGTILYLTSFGQDTHFILGLSDIREHPASSSCTVKTGDDTTKDYTNLQSIPTIGTGIQRELQDRDWIALQFNVWTHKKGSPFIFSIGESKNQGVGINKQDIKTTIADGTAQFSIVLFCLKTESGFVTFVPYNYFGTEWTKTPDEYSGTKAMESTETNISTDKEFYPRLSTLGTTEEDIKQQFSGFYKLTSYTGQGIPCYTYSNIGYWNNYTATRTTEIDVKVDYTYIINNTVVQRKSVIPNLWHNGNNTESITYKTTKNINISNILQNIMNFNLVASDKIYNGETFINLKGNKQSIYTKDGSVVKSIFNSNVSLNGNYLQITENTGLKSMILTCRQEEQGCYIQDIKLVNKIENKTYNKNYYTDSSEYFVDDSDINE